MSVRIYNPSPTTAGKIQRGEFSKISLAAGYQAGVNYGVIFSGDIKHVYIGRENNIDNYVEILAGDGDFAFNFAVANTTVAAGASSADVFNSLSKYAKDNGLDVDPAAVSVFASTGGVMPRGAVLFGLWRSEMTKLCRSAQARWSIKQGKLIVIPDTGYLPGEVVVMNSQTGLVGVPQVTDNGITARMLLNGKLQIGGRVKIDQADINKQIVQQQGYPNYNSLYFPAQTTTDGTYRVLVLNHEGDTRGQAWYTDIVCLALQKDTVAQAYPGSSNLVGATLG
jgi:hypothetical protein